MNIKLERHTNDVETLDSLNKSGIRYPSIDNARVQERMATKTRYCFGENLYFYTHGQVTPMLQNHQVVPKERFRTGRVT